MCLPCLIKACHVYRQASLYQTLENSHHKLQQTLTDTQDNLKTSQYNLSRETQRAAEAEGQLDKIRLESKNFATLRHNLESTVTSHGQTISQRDQEIKLLQRGALSMTVSVHMLPWLTRYPSDLDRLECSSGAGESRIASERDALIEKTKKLEAECNSLRASSPQVHAVLLILF